MFERVERVLRKIFYKCILWNIIYFEDGNQV